MEAEELLDRKRAQEALGKALARRLTPVGVNENGEPCYAVEDILALLGPPTVFKMRSEDPKPKRKQARTLH